MRFKVLYIHKNTYSVHPVGFHGMSLLYLPHADGNLVSFFALFIGSWYAEVSWEILLAILNIILWSTLY